MSPPRSDAGDHAPVRQVNHILQSLRGEQFRHARNAQRKPASSSSLSFHAHNQPTLPLDLIYPTQAPETGPSRVPGPSLPRSWRSPSSPSPVDVRHGVSDTPAWRERALSLIFSPDFALSPPNDAPVRPRPIYPDPSPVPQLTLLCLQLVRAACPGPDLAAVAPFIPRHLCRALVRYAAVHAPLSQTELDALCGGAAHVDVELVVAGPHNALRGRNAFRRNGLTADDDDDDGLRHGADADTGSSGSAADSSWDAMHAREERDGGPAALRSLAVLSSPLSTATLLAFPPTITHLALIHIPHRIPLLRLPTTCPLLVLLDVSYNAWLHDFGLRGPLMLEQVEWSKLRKLKVLGLRECPVTPRLLLELNRGRWEDIKIIR